MRWLLPLALLACSEPPPERKPLIIRTDAGSPASAAPASAAPASAAPASAARDVGAIDRERAARAALDETLWAAEEAAQRHEQVFVALWDALRAGDAFEVARGFAVGSVVLPTLSVPEILEHGITRQRATGPGATLDRSTWPTQLATWQQAGVEVFQTEWHHAGFEPAQGSEPARSRMKMELHVRQGGLRHVLKGMLHITWQALEPVRIEVAELVIHSRAEPVLFNEIQRLPIGPHRPTALVVHDLDGDGRPEILLPGTNQLYRRDGDQYTVSPLHPQLMPDTDAAVLADVDGDRQLDLLGVGRLDGRLVVALYRGGPGGFSPPTVVFDPPTPLERVRVLVPGDVDRDGDLDFWLAQYRGAYNQGRMPSPFDDANDGWPGYLLRNEGGRFTDATEAAGLAARRLRHTQSAAFFDLEGDGDVDLLTVNDFAGVDLHRNDGTGRFVEATAEVFDHEDLFGMAHAFGDFNGDGLLDLFATGMNSTTVKRLNGLGLVRPEQPDHRARRTSMTFGNRLYLGQAGGRFVQAPFAGTAAESGWAWGTVAFDVENDGDDDLYVANGFVSGRTAKDYCTRYWRHDVYFDNQMDPGIADVFLGELIEEVESGISWNGFEHDRLFLNRNGQLPNEGFSEVGFLLGLGAEADGRGVVATDLNADGRTDLLVAQAPPGGSLRLSVLQNNAPATHGWIGVRVGGVNAFDARITLETPRDKRVAVVTAGDSFMAQHPPDRVFGLGDTPSVTRLTVRWPDGQEIIKENPALNRWHRFER